MIKKILLIIIILGFTGCKKQNEVKHSIRTKKHFKIDNKIYNCEDVDVRPDFIGDYQLQAFIKKNYVKSEEIIRDEIQAGIFTKFIVEKDSSLSHIEIVRDFGYGSGEELVRVLKLGPKMIPAMKDGQPVRCIYSIPYYVTIDE